MQKFNQFKPKKRTLDIQSMPQNEKEYTYFVKTFSKLHKKITQKLLFKPLAAGTLALFMGIGTLCGVLLAPISGSAAASMASQGSQTGQQAGKNASANLSAENQAKAELDANIIAGGDLGLDPENDPVIFTTDWGLDLKFHNAGEGEVSLYQPSNGTSTSSGLSGYTYFVINNTNWVIIGQYKSSSYVVNAVTGSVFSNLTPDSVVAGSAIFKDAEKALIKTNTITIPSFPNAIAPSNGEIPFGCVLCIAENYLSQGPYSSSQAKYSTSTARSTITTYYNGLSSAVKKQIVPQTLKTRCLSTQDSEITDSMFLLATTEAGGTQNFCLETYLTSNALRKTSGGGLYSIWWTRSGNGGEYANRAYSVYGGNGGSYYHYAEIGKSYNIRPAFVLRLYSA